MGIEISFYNILEFMFIWSDVTSPSISIIRFRKNFYVHPGFMSTHIQRISDAEADMV